MQSEGIDASTFQPILFGLSKTMIHLVERASVKEANLPPRVAEDVGMLLRLSAGSLAVLYYIHRETFDARNPFCLPEYPFVTLPQIRVLIDCLYNVVLLLESPEEHGKSYRADGYRQLDESSRKIIEKANDSARTEGLERLRNAFALSRRAEGISDEEVKNGSWLTINSYLKKSEKSPSTNSKFLERFTYGPWQEYSSISHATFWGLNQLGPFLRPDYQLPEDRDAFREEGRKPASFHLLRATYVYLCILCEVEDRLSLGDHARVRQRLRDVWVSLADHVGEVEADARQPFEERYGELLALF